MGQESPQATNTQRVSVSRDGTGTARAREPVHPGRPQAAGYHLRRDVGADIIATVLLVGATIILAQHFRPEKSLGFIGWYLLVVWTVMGALFPGLHCPRNPADRLRIKPQFLWMIIWLFIMIGVFALLVLAGLAAGIK
jgi:hypothetical protein